MTLAKNSCTECTKDPSSELALVRSQLEQLEIQYASLNERTGQLSALQSAVRAMMKQESLDKLLQFIADEIVRLTIANGAYMHMVHETEEYLLVVAAHGKLTPQLKGATRKKGIGMSAAAWEAGEYVYTDKYNENYNQVVVFAEETKAVAIPLSFSGNISGVVFVTADTNEDLQSEIPLLEEIGRIASMIIFYTQQLELQTEELRRIKSLSVLGETLYQSTDWECILNSVSTHLFEIFDIDRVAVHQPSATDDKLITQAVHVKIDGKVQSKKPKAGYVSENSIVSWCYKNNEFAQINRHVKDPRETTEVHEFLATNKIGSTICLPVGHTEKPWGVFIMNKHADKRDFDQRDVDTIHSVASQLCTALQRNNLLAEVQHQAYHDKLTNLPNRRSFEQHISQQIDQQSNNNFAIIFCDLNGFKTINDTHGHDIGDEVLGICASRLKASTHDDDFLARIGGDEFVALVELSDNNRDIDRVAERLIQSLSEPIHTKDLRLQVGASIGISFYPQDGKKYSDLLNHADIAMYQAKNNGGGKIARFDKKHAEEIRKKSEMRTDLLSALSRDEFELWYQPQVDWASSTVTGVEALIRWNHPDGMVSPFIFIPIAEESGFIEPLGMWVMEEAIAELGSGVLSDHPDLKMGINIAPPQFNDPQFSDKIFALLKKYNVAPSRLKAEITESFIMQDRDNVVEHLKQLRHKGVQVAIDDFGTGYSSLSYLQDLPLDVLKIDRSFVTALTQSNYDKSIAASIIALANSLGLTTITEGVETDEQLQFIQNLGSETIQGYYYSKPVPASELLAAIDKIESTNVSRLWKKSA